MSFLLLDTNIVSALMGGDRQVEDLLLDQRPGGVCLMQPVIAEIRYGLSRLPSSRRRTELVERFELLSGVLPRVAWSDEVSWWYGSLKAALERRGERLEDFDLAIAAHALAMDATLVTRNERHFSRIPDLKAVRW